MRLAFLNIQIPSIRDNHFCGEWRWPRDILNCRRRKPMPSRSSAMHPTRKSAAFAALLLAFLAPGAPAADPAPPPNVNRYGQRLDLRAELSGESETHFGGNWNYRILLVNEGVEQLILPGVAMGRAWSSSSRTAKAGG
jgi:hypothetical protein